MERKIKALIFDVGAVLCLVKNMKKRTSKNLLSSYREACFLLKDISVDPEQVYSNTKEIYFKSSAGKISKTEALGLFSKALDVSPKKTEKVFEDVYRKNTIENKKLYDHVLKLKKEGYKIGILSTQFHLSKKILIPEKYYKNFNALVISCDDKLKKPDPKSFELILRRLRVKPNQVLFIDDKQENLDAAEKLSIKSLIFKNNTQFFNGLKKLGIT